MTKKEKTLLSTLELFANEGYHGIPTQQAANQTGVSEGLTFKHFTSKKELLSKIMEQAHKWIQEIFCNILFKQDPQEVIRDTINLVFNMLRRNSIFGYRNHAT